MTSTSAAPRNWLRNAAVLGALVVGAINNGLYLIGFNSDAQQIITALVLLTGVVIDAVSRRGQRYVGRG